MSQVPKRRPPIRKVVSQVEPVEEPVDELAEEPEEEEEYFPAEETNRPRGRRNYSQYEDDYPRGRRDYPRDGGDYRSRSVAPRRDPFPIIIGAMVGALMVGLVVIVYLLASRSGGGTTTTTTSSNPSSLANTVPTLNSTDNQPASQASPSGSPPPRMPLADFKALYDDPAKRPLVIDVRAKDAYETGHIKGAFSAPESDIDALVVKIPKDKLVIAYCQ